MVSHVPPLGLNLSPALSPPPPPPHCYLQPLISSFSSSTPICLAKWDSMRDFLWENDSPEEKQWNTDGKRMHELASFSLYYCTLGVPFTWNTSSPSLFEGLIQGLLLPAGGLSRTNYTWGVGACFSHGAFSVDCSISWSLCPSICPSLWYFLSSWHWCCYCVSSLSFSLSRDEHSNFQ